MRIAEFRQTPFVSHEDKNLVYLRVEDWDLCNAYFVRVSLDGTPVCEKKVFAPQVSLLLPACRTQTVCRIRITPFEDTPIEEDFVLLPQPERQVALIYSAHEDLGYCGYV